jgi:uncharacterized DUF497 family protein
MSFSNRIINGESGEESSFVWDFEKELLNIEKHGINFTTAARAFKDPNRMIFVDSKHSHGEERYFCLGKVDRKILTVRFVHREDKIRIIGAGYWRRGIRYYEKENNKL